MIKNIEDLKNIQIVCKNEQDIENCSKMLRELWSENTFYSKYKVFLYSSLFNNFTNQMELRFDLDTYFFNKKFIKTLQKIIKEEKEKKKVEDIEVASDGRITKINNWESKKCLYFIGAWDYGTINFDDFKREGFEYYINLGLAYETKEARDRASFKIEIENKLKNIAERLNKGQKIDWKNRDQYKFFIFYDNDNEILRYHYNFRDKEQGKIYCLDENFLEVAKQEIGEENLIKYFKE